MSPVKAIASIVGLGLAATAVGVGTHSLSSSNNSTVEERMKSKRNEFLNFDYENDEVAGVDEKAGGGASSYSDWLMIISNYYDEENVEKFEDLSFEYKNESNGYNSFNQETIKKFKKRCRELLISKGNEKNLNLFNRYCIRPQR